MRSSFLFFLLLFAASSLLLAQVPQGISYQAVVRDGPGIYANQTLDIRFSIRSDSPGGTVVFSETQSLTTNQYGLIIATIGQGNAGIGSLGAIDWAADEYFLEVEVDENGGWIGLSNTRLESVPYSQYAAKAHMELNDLLNVATTPTTGQILRWDGTSWVAGEDQDQNTTYNSGAGISISASNLINNTGDLDPSDDVLIGSSASGDLTGTYPAPQIKAIQGMLFQGQPDSGDVWKWDGNAWVPGPDDFEENHWTKIQDDLYYQGGKVGIGTSQPAQPFHLFAVDSITNDTRGLFVDLDKLTNGGGNTTGIYIDAYKSGVTGTTYGGNIRSRNYNTGSSPAYGSFNFAYKQANSGAAYGVYGTTGGVAAVEYAGFFDGDVYSTGSYLPSDQTLKTEITPVASALEKILDLRVKSYAYQQTAFPHMHLPKGTQVGFVAQELGQVFPELVRQQLHPAADPEAVAAGEMPAGSEVSFLGLNYVGLIPYLTRAMQEQQHQLNEKETRIQQLEAKVSAQEALLLQIEQRLDALE